MTRIYIDVEQRTAWAETGLTAGEYTAAAGAHGLATGFGDTGSVGIGEGGAYVTFLRDEGEERVRGAYPGSTFERLAAIKGRYDLMNLFRLNHNIPPATEGRTT